MSNPKIVIGGFTQTKSGLVVPDRRPALPPGAKAINVPIGELMIDGPALQLHVDKYQIKISNYPGDCGIDLFPSGIQNTKRIGEVWSLFIVDTGIRLVFPLGSWGLIMGRNSMPERLGGGFIEQELVNSGDTSFLTVRVICHNFDADAVRRNIETFIREKHALAQVVPLPFWYPTFMALDEKMLIKGRGGKGMGTTDNMTLAEGMNKPPTIIS